MTGDRDLYALTGTPVDERDTSDVMYLGTQVGERDLYALNDLSSTPARIDTIEVVLWAAKKVPPGGQ